MLENKELMPHQMILEDRKRMRISGVVDVENFDEMCVELTTSAGLMTIKGEEMHVESLNLENGEMTLTGEVQSVEYEESRERGSLLSRLFG
jgi:sporulation protein YabP